MGTTHNLYTIGHSNRTLEEFIELLNIYEISHLVDIRSIPKSRYVPWFNEKNLARSLQNKNILYTWLPDLGGRRHTSKDSINLGWHNTSFRGFADYMQTPAFYKALKNLNELLKTNNRVAIMCAEAVPWRCHRSLIGDAEIIRHIKVLDIISKTNVTPHKLTAFAVVDRNKRPMQIYYPDGEQLSLLKD